eukprot:8091492-Alexandrium_andersonii.AAC.1
MELGLGIHELRWRESAWWARRRSAFKLHAAHSRSRRYAANPCLGASRLRWPRVTCLLYTSDAADDM